MLNTLVFLALGLVGEGTFWLHSREQGRRHDKLVSTLLRQNAALVAATLAKDGDHASAAVVQTLGVTESALEDSVRESKQARRTAVPAVRPFGL